MISERHSCGQVAYEQACTYRTIPGESFPTCPARPAPPKPAAPRTARPEPEPEPEPTSMFDDLDDLDDIEASLGLDEY